MARPQVVEGGTVSNMDGSCEYILKKQTRRTDKGCSLVWILGKIQTNPQHKTWHRYKYVHVFGTCIDSSVQYMQMRNDVLVYYKRNRHFTFCSETKLLMI